MGASRVGGGGYQPRLTKTAKPKAATVTVAGYDNAQPTTERAICKRLRAEITKVLPKASSKVWHGAPVWFVGDTPVVGYSVPKRGGVSLLFWNGQAFGDTVLEPMGKFRAAQAWYGNAAEIKLTSLRRWLKQAGTDLWDYRSIRGGS